jgi:adenosylcobinamide kinase / adenosylcobinamide-phosphate guanylyltransferase
MNFIFGGSSQGKLKFAIDKYGQNVEVYDLKKSSIFNIMPENKQTIINLQDGVSQLLKAGLNPKDYLEKNIDKFYNKVLIGNEIGCGIVSMDAFEREWRDETGRVYQFIVTRSNIVDRVWAGLGMNLKSLNIS